MKTGIRHLRVAAVANLLACFLPFTHRTCRGNTSIKNIYWTCGGT